MVDIAGEDRFDVVGRRVEIGELDRRAERADRGRGRRQIAAAGKVRAHVHRDFGLGHRLDETVQRCGRSGLEEPAAGQKADQRRIDAQHAHRRGRAEPDLPAERLVAGGEALAPAGQAARRMPRAMRGSSQGLIFTSRCL